VRGRHIAIGDFNRDGDPDLLTAEVGAFAVRLNYSRTVQFTSPTLLAQETNGSVSITVTLNHASLLPVSVVYATSDSRQRTSVQGGLIGGIGFWHSDRGQSFIMQMGGPLLYNSLGFWLIYNFPNLYGAPYENGLYDTTNAGVASYFQKLFDMPGPRLEAKVLALALSVYATTRSLGGDVAEAYGFTVTDHGLFAYTFNVGADGAAFGVADNSVLTVYELLQAVNARANRALLYYYDPALRKKATDLLGNLADAGAI